MRIICKFSSLTGRRSKAKRRVSQLCRLWGSFDFHLPPKAQMEAVVFLLRPQKQVIKIPAPLPNSPINGRERNAVSSGLFPAEGPDQRPAQRRTHVCRARRDGRRRTGTRTFLPRLHLLKSSRVLSDGDQGFPDLRLCPAAPLHPLPLSCKELGRRLGNLTATPLLHPNACVVLLTAVWS